MSDSPTTDVLVPVVHNLLWKKGHRDSGWLFSGPVVAPMSDRYSRRDEKRLEPVTLISVVPDDLSTLWVWRQSEFDKDTVKEGDCYLPLRFRGHVYEECVSRAKNYLVDRLLPDTLPEQRVNIRWEFNRLLGCWTLCTDAASSLWTIGDGAGSAQHLPCDKLNTETDPLVALAKAVAATEKARMDASMARIAERLRNVRE
jgi:hypothetical protein